MISAFDLFKIGIGPSSSHTVGPMRASKAFIDSLRADSTLARVERLSVVLLGSLAWTGRGHGSDRAVIAGLQGERPDTIDPSALERLLQRAISEHCIEIMAYQIGCSLRKFVAFAHHCGAIRLIGAKKFVQFESINGGRRARGDREGFRVQHQLVETICLLFGDAKHGSDARVVKRR